MNCNTPRLMEISNISDKLKIKILKGVLNKDELGKPYIEYVTEITYDTQNWRVLKKFNQYANFHKSLKNIMGEEFKFPESANIFMKISDNNNNFHENKIKQLEAYVRELSNIPIISNSKIFKRFFEFHLNVDENLNEDIDLQMMEKKGTFKGHSNITNNTNNNTNQNFYKTFGSGYQSDNSENSKDFNSPQVNIYSNSNKKNKVEYSTFGDRSKMDSNNKFGSYNLNNKFEL